MKVIIDTAILFKLPEIYEGKCEEVLYRAIESAHNNFAHCQDEFHLTYEEVIRLQAIERRKDVGHKEIARDILNHLNTQSGKNFRTVEANLKLIMALLKNNYPRKDIEMVIDNKVAKWKGTAMDDYLRPSTLFRLSNFESYVNEIIAPEVAENNFSKELDSILGGK